MKSRPELVPLISENVIESMLQRFHEKDENVKLDIFSAISTYVKLCSVTKISQYDDKGTELELI